MSFLSNSLPPIVTATGTSSTPTTTTSTTTTTNAETTLNTCTPPSCGPPPIPCIATLTATATATAAATATATSAATGRKSESLDDLNLTSHSMELRELMMVKDPPATATIGGTTTGTVGTTYVMTSHGPLMVKPSSIAATATSAASRSTSRSTSRSRTRSAPQELPPPKAAAAKAAKAAAVDQVTVNQHQLLATIAALQERIETLEKQQQAQAQINSNFNAKSSMIHRVPSDASSMFEFLNGSAMNGNASFVTTTKNPTASAFDNALSQERVVNAMMHQYQYHYNGNGSSRTLGESSQGSPLPSPSPRPFRRTVLLTRDHRFSHSTPNLLPTHIPHGTSFGGRTTSTGSTQSAPTPITVPTLPSLPSLLEEQSERRWGKLREAMGNTCQHDFSKKSTLVFLHPEEVGERDYTPEELEKIQYRPFPSRLFITNIQLEWNTVWLRTRHTDHHCHRSSYIQVRDAFKADAITNNPPGAKYALTELLNMCYGMNESDYYSFACTLASAFSNQAANTEFERELLLHAQRKQAIIQEMEYKHQPIPDWNSMKLLKEEQTRARIQLLQLMDIVFSKLKQKKILVDGSKENIYRLVLCMTKYNRNPWPYFYAIFSFFFQLCAATYVALSLTTIDDGDMKISHWENGTFQRNIALAFGTVCYGIMVAYPEMKSTGEVFRCLYRSDFSPLASMDFVINFILPLVCAICGFFVVLQADSFLEGVLNAVALIFITEIDDQLPRLLELDTSDIVQGFLIDQAMEEYETQNLAKKIPEIEFSDMHITNTEESGSIPSRGITFQPYEVFGEASSLDKHGNEPSQTFTMDQIVARRAIRPPSITRTRSSGHSRKRTQGVRVRQGDMGQQVANKRSVTADCLLRKIEWQYTGGFDQASRPRIGHLRLHKLSDEKLVDIVGKQKAKPEMNKPWFSITGVYIITSFSMSDDVLRLRICGSQTTDSFLRAFKYYNLWPLEKSAQNLLKRQVIAHTPEEITNNNIVLYGSERRRPTPPTIAEVSPTHETTAQAQVVYVPASKLPKDWEAAFARLEESPEEEEIQFGVEGESTEEEELCIPPMGASAKDERDCMA